MNRKPSDPLLNSTASGLAASLLFCSLAAAQGFPSKPIKVVVPYSISGPTDVRGTPRMSRSYRLMAPNAPPAISDTLARIIAQALGAESRHPVTLERVPGALTTRGAVTVARAPADGHTLLLASNATMVINPNFYHGVEYDPVRDFVLVAPLATMPFVLLVHAGVPVETPGGLVKWLTPRPGEINYGSSGAGSTGHLAGELFRRMARVSVVHVSFNGGVAALTGLAQGQVSFMFAALPLALPYLPSEHFQPLAVASAGRLERLPGVPTLAESGLAGYDIEGWYGLFAPAGTAPTAIAWLREPVAGVVSSRAVGAHLRGLGLEPATMKLEQFATRILTESDKWAPLLRASRVPLRDEGRRQKDEG